MAAVFLRLCEEDRAKYPGGDEDGWVRFDEAALDDLDLITLNRYESELNVSLEFLLLVDKPSRTTRWTAAQLWMARDMAGIKTPPLVDFNIKPRRIEVKDEPKPRRAKTKAADAAPLSSSPSSPDEVSETASD